MENCGSCLDKPAQFVCKCDLTKGFCNLHASVHLEFHQNLINHELINIPELFNSQNLIIALKNLENLEKNILNKSQKFSTIMFKAIFQAIHKINLFHAELFQILNDQQTSFFPNQLALEAIQLASLSFNGSEANSNIETFFSENFSIEQNNIFQAIFLFVFYHQVNFFIEIINIFQFTFK